VLFTHNYPHTIDAKQRLAIPAPIRNEWRVEQDGLAWFAVPWVGNVIRLYTEKDFTARARSGFLSLTPDEDEAELQATLFGLTCRLEMDSAGRIRIPEDMLQLTGLGPEVVLVGCGDRLEVRDRKTWIDTKRERLAQLPELMARISAKKERAPRS